MDRERFELLVLRALWLIMRWQMGYHVVEDADAWRRDAEGHRGSHRNSRELFPS